MRPLLLVFSLTATVMGQQPQQPPVYNPPTTMPAPAPVEKTGDNTYRIGEMQLDTRKKELVVPGSVNDVAVLEFVANTLGGFKAYESALTLNTNAVSFNAALLVLGVDPAHSRAPEMQFDPKPPQGDPVELTVSWTDGRRTRRVPVEELIYDQRTKKTLKEGPWVYTGSTLYKTESGPMFMAETDGVLIGFMHGPQAVIDNPRDDARNGFGMIVLNPNLGLKPGTAITLTVKVLPLKN
jgi:hypothetical protein